MSATRERSLDLDLCDGFEWRGQSTKACVAGVERGGKRGEIIREGGARGRERKEAMQTFQVHFITMLNVN